MPVITNPPSAQNQHVRATYTFVTATTGTVAAHTLFTVTGVVLVRALTGIVTVNLTSGGAATVAVGHSGNPAAWGGSARAYNLFTTTANILNSSAQPASNSATAMGQNVVTDSNILITIATAAVDAGAIVFDVFYDAVTDNGAIT